MAFVWVQDISSGAVIDAVDAIEIRTNIDTVDNEKCAAHKISYKLDYKDGVDTGHYPGYYSNQHGSYKSGHLSGYDSTHKVNVLSDENTTYLSGHLAGYDSTYYTGAKTSYYPGYV
ncbi:unnamed protein product [marine sediment metagenome]|uniref:Uncharacterized protein n=1 Tax=marine sediment metagenome TaxID=412755 RepID=X1PWN1_9ZZZZ